MDKHSLARIFNELGLLLELKGENPFKVRAYYNAARTIENLAEDLASLIRENRLREVPGIGEAIAQKIGEWVATGTLEYYENLKAATPPGLFEMLRIPGMGPKKVWLVYQELGITSLEALETACEDQLLQNLAGFGVKTQEKIRAGIQFVKAGRGQFLWFEGMAAATPLLNRLREHHLVIRAELAGSLRRYKEVTKDIDIVVSAKEPGPVMNYWRELPEVESVSGSGPTKTAVRLKAGIAADLRVVAPQEFTHAWHHFTGSKEHNTSLRRLAKTLGYKVNEYGLFNDRDEPFYAAEEAELYHTLGLEYIPPELREDLGEIEAAQQGRLPKLISTADLKGIFHIHTTYSDGAATLKEMAEAVKALGYTYMGVADHSQSAVYAHGLHLDSLRRQWDEIDALNEESSNFKILKGIETDILASGELDYNDEILAGFDFIIGSIHSRFQMGREAMTARILRAMDHPQLTMLGHPTGRILLERNGYELDLEAVLDKAAVRGVVLEFNANPYRLDLDWRWIRQAKTRGIKLAINPDAHHPVDLQWMASSLRVASKGWLEAGDVVNAKTTSEMKAYLDGRRKGVGQ